MTQMPVACCSFLPGSRALLLCVLLSACGTTKALEPRFEPPERPTPERVLADTIAKAAAAKPSTPPAIAVGVTAAPVRLCAWDAQGKLLWQHAIDARSAPLVAGNFVVLAEPSGIVVRDLMSGATRVVLDERASLVAADGDGDQLVVAMQEHEDGREGGLLAFFAGGDVRWKRRLTLPVGTPALAGGRVLVPWATNRLSILELADGAESARWTAARAMLGHVVVRDGRIYAGQHQLWALGPELFEAGSRGGPAPAPTPVPRPLPAQPPLLRDGYSSAPEPGSVSHRVRLDWSMAGANSATRGPLFLRFYRLLFAFDAAADRVRWVHVLARDIVGAGVIEGGVVVAEADGSLHRFGDDGAHQTLGTVGAPLQALVLSAPARMFQGAQTAPVSAPEELADQLIAAATLEDDRLVEGRAYAAQRLATLEGDAVTAQLVELCSASSYPEPVRRAACAGVAERPDGGAAVVAALRLGVATGSSLTALARAAARMQLQKAAPLLLPYVSDVATGPAELTAVITALAALGHRPAAGPIERFLRLHHAEPEGSELTAALSAGADALAELRAGSSRAELERVVADGFSHPGLRASAERAVATLKAPKPKPVVAAKAAPPAPPKAAPEVDARPATLSSQMVATALAPLRGKLLQCLRDAPDKPRQSRLSMVADGDGTVERVFVTPPSMQTCIEPLVRARALPSTRGGRQRVNYVLRDDEPKQPKAK